LFFIIKIVLIIINNYTGGGKLAKSIASNSAYSVFPLLLKKNISFF